MVGAMRATTGVAIFMGMMRASRGMARRESPKPNVERTRVDKNKIRRTGRNGTSAAILKRLLY
jgi:hypothetical protein